MQKFCKICNEKKKYYKSSNRKYGFYYCLNCQKDYHKLYRKYNPQKYGEKQRLYFKKWILENKEIYFLKQKLYFRKLRKETLDKYGGKCICCGEKKFEFLAFDHKNNDGGKFRKSVGAGTTTVQWIIKNNYPTLFQILCHNCNQAKGYYGSCPHQRS